VAQCGQVKIRETLKVDKTRSVLPEEGQPTAEVIRALEDKVSFANAFPATNVFTSHMVVIV
jgi:hypothetical protein